MVRLSNEMEDLKWITNDGMQLLLCASKTNDLDVLKELRSMFKNDVLEKYEDLKQFGNTHYFRLLEGWLKLNLQIYDLSDTWDEDEKCHIEKNIEDVETEARASHSDLIGLDWANNWANTIIYEFESIKIYVQAMTSETLKDFGELDKESIQKSKDCDDQPNGTKKQQTNFRTRAIRVLQHKIVLCVNEYKGDEIEHLCYERKRLIDIQKNKLKEDPDSPDRQERFNSVVEEFDESQCDMLNFKFVLAPILEVDEILTPNLTPRIPHT